MTETPISPGLINRVTQAARYVISGVAPDAWFGPLQPLAPIAPPEVAGRRFDYPSGYNLNSTPRASEEVTFEELRALSDNCDILRSVIETRKDQIEAQDWTIRVLANNGSVRAPQATDDQKRRIDAIQSFLLSPDKEHGFDQWLRQILEDMFVIDGVAIYKRRNRAGRLYALEVLDASTIKLLLDDSGRAPLPPSPAYQQILKGVPAADYTREELMYLVHNPRSHKVYGYSHVEQVLMTVNILIRRSVHQLEYYRDGSIPDALIGTPKEWTVDQIAAFQKGFDAMLSGNSGMRRRARFMPGDFKYQETKAPPLKDAYDEFLARVVCFVFSISPEPFVGQVNRSTAESSHSRAVDEGLAPLMRFVRNLLNRIIACEFASPDLEFAWTETRAQDPSEAAQIDVAYVGAGILTVDEVRANMGLAPLAQSTKPVAMPETGITTHKYNSNHLGPGPGGGQFTTDGFDGTSNGLPARSGMSARNEIAPGSSMPRGTQVAGDNTVPDSSSQQSIHNAWDNPETLMDHVERHASDFDIDPQMPDAAEQYTQKANDFFKQFRSENLPAVEYPNGGEIGVYNPNTNTFGVYTADGQTQSFYKPTSPTYFQREVQDVVTRGGSIINPLSSTQEAPEIIPNISPQFEPETEVEPGTGGNAERAGLGLPSFRFDREEQDEEPKL